jgi:hypothetical protein
MWLCVGFSGARVPLYLLCLFTVSLLPVNCSTHSFSCAFVEPYSQSLFHFCSHFCCFVAHHRFTERGTVFHAHSFILFRVSLKYAVCVVFALVLALPSLRSRSIHARVCAQGECVDRSHGWPLANESRSSRSVVGGVVVPVRAVQRRRLSIALILQRWSGSGLVASRSVART